MEARRAYYATALEEYVERTLADAGPLPPTSVDRVVAILRSGAPPGNARREEPIPAANPVSGRNLPHTDTKPDGQVRPSGGAAA